MARTNERDGEHDGQGGRPHVVILGGGFGGLYAARALRRAPVQLTLIDRHNYHLFQPLLYQVATAALNPSDIAYPIRHVLRRQKNAEVLLGEAIGVDPARRVVLLADGEVPYDKLVVATGATHSYFNHPEWAARAPGLKSIEDAIEIRRRVLLAYELAERETDPARREAWMTFVIVGGGPTGVELAGAFAEIARQALPGDFRHIDPARAKVILLEGAPRVLPPYTPDSSAQAQKQLEDLGVEVRAPALVTEIDDEGVTYKAGSDGAPESRLPARTVIWAAGVAASPIAKSLGVPLDRAGRVKVEPDLTIPGHPDVFVIGDLAALTGSDGKPVPGVAPAAIQEGRHAAEGGAVPHAGGHRDHRRNPRWIEPDDEGQPAEPGGGVAVERQAVIPGHRGTMRKADLENNGSKPHGLGILMHGSCLGLTRK